MFLTHIQIDNIHYTFLLMLFVTTLKIYLILNLSTLNFYFEMLVGIHYTEESGKDILKIKLLYNKVFIT